MKKSINNLNEALAFHLEGMHSLERMIEEKLGRESGKQSQAALDLEIARYGRSSKYKRMKLKRVFGYLMIRPYGRDENISVDLVQNIQRGMAMSGSNDAANLILTLDLTSLVAYKMVCYEQAMLISERLQLETATYLLEEIKEMENVSLALFKNMAATFSSRLEKEAQLVS